MSEILLSTEAMLRSLPVPCAAIGPDGRVVVANPAFTALLRDIDAGASNAAAWNAACSDKLGADCEGMDLAAWLSSRTDESLPPGLVSGEAIEGSLLSLERKPNEPVILSVSAAVANEETGLRLVVFRDLSRDYLREEKLRKDKEDAVQKTRTKSLFLANMSHEIRTPIQTISSVTELLLDTRLDREQEEYARQIQFACDTLFGLVNDILDLSKIEAGKLDLEKIPFDPRAVVEQSVDLLALEAHRKGLEVVIDIDPRVPASMRGDPTRLKQILINLIKNAVKFTKAGEVLVCARLDSDTKLEIAVADSGIGVPSDAREKIFAGFTQADASTLRKYGGTGLGLSISRNLAGLMGGEIELRDNKPHGSIFSIRVPIVDYIAAPAFEPIAGSSPGTGCRCLLVDDNPIAREVAKGMLESIGVEAIDARGGAEALDKLRAAAIVDNRYDLCVIDMNMPEMDGWRLAAQINADREINSTKLVLMIPEGLIGADAKMKQLRWFNGYLMKPIKRVALTECLSRVLYSDMDLEPAEETKPSGEGVPNYAGALILVAEDHPINQELFRVVLEKLGCRVTIASDGEQAIWLTGTEDPDLIFMDIQMPLLDGYQATQAIRAHVVGTPIIAVTASAVAGERERCIEAGMNDIMTKPFKRKDVVDMLDFWLKSIKRRDGETGASPSKKPPPPINRQVDKSVFDLDEAVDTFMGRRDTVISLLGKFAESARGHIAEAERGFASGNFPQVRAAAHAIKGGALNLTALRLGNAAAFLEKTSENADPNQIARAIEALKASLEEFANSTKSLI